MVAVVLAAGSLNGYAGALAAFDVHEHGSHGLHDHMAGHDHGDASDLADAAHDQDRCCDGDPAAKLCTQMHVHCCCAYAVPAADLVLKLADEHATVAAAVSHMPHGQLASPLFRPPRAIA